MARKKAQNKTQNNQYRIIGGKWRGRKLPFVDAIGLRPTPDRIRETLFNWLQADINGAHCLDLFAGSGALGFEALSRGASHLVLIEKDRACAKQLKENLALVNVTAESTIKSASVLEGDALDFVTLYGDNVKQNDKPFDILFLDPPYRQGIIEKSLQYLDSQNLFDSQSLIYAEHEAEEVIDWVAFDLEVLKQAKAGQVKSFLLSKIQ